MNAMTACPCGRQTAGSAVLCRACMAEVRDGVVELLHVVDDLEVTLARQAKVAVPSPTTGAPLGKRDGQPLPFDLGAARELHDLEWLARSWRAVLDPGTRLAPEGARAALRGLLSVLPVAAGHQDAPRLKAAVRAAYSAAVLVIDHPKHLVWLGPCRVQLTETVQHAVWEGVSIEVDAGECPGSVRAATDDDTAVCTTCGAEFDAVQRRRWLLDAAGEQQLTVADLARYLAAYGLERTPAAARNAVRYLVRAGRLHFAAVDDDDHRLYRLGDVLDALANRRTYRRNSA